MILLSLTGVGCVPIPHNTRFAPDTTVVLTRGGEPLRGQAVGFRARAGAKPPVEIVDHTDDDGVVRFEAARPFRAVLLMGDRLDVWTVRIPFGSDLRIERQAPWGGPRNEQIHCDLPEPLQQLVDVTVDRHHPDPIQLSLPNGGLCTVRHPR